jgi:hypothetical protein
VAATFNVKEFWLFQLLDEFIDREYIDPQTRWLKQEKSIRTFRYWFDNEGVS